MGDKSTIEWTGATWNCVTGCTKVSPGCKFCYAERMAKRLQAMGSKRYANGFRVTLHEDVLDLPLHWKKPRKIFVNSMSDLFHEDVPFEFILRVYEVMAHAHWHVFQLLTKRVRRAAAFTQYCVERGRYELLALPNAWLGVSTENQDAYTDRVSVLAHDCQAAVKWISAEPLLGPIHLGATGRLHLSWVVCGGESGPGARPMDPEWVRSLRWQCSDAKIPFWLKQWGKLSNNPDPFDHTAKENGGHAKGGCVLDGRRWEEWPIGTGEAGRL